MSRGNGLAMDLYCPFRSFLLEQFDLQVHDPGNHGWNAFGRLQSHQLPNLVRDRGRIAATVDRHYGRRRTVCVFHSISVLSTLPWSNRCGEVAALVLFDPPLRRGLWAHLARDTSAFEIPSPMYRGMRSTVFRFPMRTRSGGGLKNLGNSRFAAALAWERRTERSGGGRSGGTVPTGLQPAKCSQALSSGMDPVGSLLTSRRSG